MENVLQRKSPGVGGGTVDYFEQFCAISKVPMVLLWFWYGMVLTFGSVVLVGDWLGVTS